MAVRSPARLVNKVHNEHGLNAKNGPSGRDANQEKDTERHEDLINPLDTEGSEDGHALLQENENSAMQDQGSIRNKISSSHNKDTKSTDEDIVPRTVTVVEHDYGFKSSRLVAKNSRESYKSNNINDEPMRESNDKNYFNEVSELSKPLSPMTSQRLSPKDQAFDFSYEKDKLSYKPASFSKNTVTFKEEGFGEEEGVLPPGKSPSIASNNSKLGSNPLSLNKRVRHQSRTSEPNVLYLKNT